VGLKKRFHKINIEISNICNLQCTFCPEVDRPKALMSIELFEKIIQQAAPLTELVCLHLMGDPLVHPKISDFIDVCARYDARVFLVTNGLLLRDSTIETLLHPNLYQVNFSLHSFPDNFPDRDPSLYLAKIFSFTEKAFEQRPELYINYRLWNLDAPNGTNENNLKLLHQIEEHFQWKFEQHVDVRSNKSLKIKNRLYLHFDTEFTWPSLDQPVLQTKGTCYGLKSHFGILADGTVVPCCLDKEGNIPLGNISDKTLEQILGDSRALKVRHGFDRHQLIEELCQKCQYIERFAD
jgi:radical SAM protein with 4Fe4S-binding SPASM domain